MTNTLTATASIMTTASATRVWEALTTPTLIKEYLFGTEVTTDWQVGSPITYKGIWEGKSYEDKGKILEVIPEKKLVSTYWSSMGGKTDLPENYNNVTYEITPTEGGTRVTITQDNVATEAEREHTTKNWTMVLEGLKKVVEK